MSQSKTEQTNEAKNKLRVQIKSRLLDLVNGFDNHGQKGLFYGRDFIDEIVGDSSLRITREKQDATSILLEEIYSLLIEDPTRLEIVYEIFFSYSPNIFENLSVESKLLFAALFSRTRELQNIISTNIVGEIVYSFSFMETGRLTKILTETIGQQDISLQLDVIDFLKTVAANAVANGDWADKCVSAIRSVLELISETTEVPMVRVAAESSLERIDKEIATPTLGFVKWTDDPSNSRLPEGLAQSDERTGYFLENSDLVIRERLKPFRVAKDAICYLDHANTPRAIGRQEKRSIENLEGEAAYLQRILSLQTRNVLQNTLDIIFNYISFYSESKKSATVIRKLSEVINVPENLLLEIYKLTENQTGDQARKRSRLTELIHQAQAIGAYEKIREICVKKIEQYKLTKPPVQKVSGYTDLNSNLHFTTADSSEVSVLLLSHLHKPLFLEKISEILGVDVRLLSIRSQIYLLKYLAGENKESLDKFVGLLGNFDTTTKLNILNSFISLSFDSKNINLIIQILEKGSSDLVEKIFDLYAQFAETSDVLSQKFIETGNRLEAEITPHLEKQLQKRMLEKAGRILSDIAKSISDSESVQHILNIADSETSMYLNFVGALLRLGVRESLLDIPHCSLEVAKGDEIKELDRRVMRDMYTTNYLDYPDEARLLLKKLEEVWNPNTRFYILRYSGNIIGFVRYSENEDGTVFAGSLNIKKYEQADSLGIKLLVETLTKEAETHVIVADCEATKFVTPIYIELGFVGTSSFDEFGKKILNIQFDRQLNAKLKSKNMGLADLQTNTDPNIQIEEAPSLSEFDFNSVSENRILTRVVKLETGGYLFATEQI